MSSRLDNLHTHFDDPYQVGGNFDHHVAPSYNYSHSAPKRLQHQQCSKSPGLLRLDSVGEVSSARLPSDSQMCNNRGNTKPVLRNCKSADFDISYTTNRLLAKSSMASAKSLNRSPSKYHSGGQHMSASLFTKTHSFAQELHPQLVSKAHSFCGVRTPSSAFDFNHQNLVLGKVFSVFPPAGTNDYSKLYSSPSHQNCPNMDAYIGRGHANEGRAASILSTFAAYAALQPSSSWTAPAASQKFLVSSKKDDTSSITKSSKSPCAQAKNHDSLKNVERLTSSPNTTSNIAPDQSDLSVIFDDTFAEETCFPAVDSSSNSDSLQSPLVECKRSGKRSRNCGALKSDNDRNSSFDDSFHNSFKSVTEISSVLSAPRKTAKKGRPSSKKQKKRQREKRKHESSPSVFTGFSTSFNNTSKVEEEQQASACDSIPICQLEESASSLLSLETSNSLLSNYIPRESSPAKAQSKCCSIANLLFMSDLEETDDDSDGSSEWSASEDEAVHTSPIKCSAFNVALNLDMIFKKKSIPSLKSVLQAEDSESDSESSSSTQSAKVNHAQNVTLCTSNDYSWEDTSVRVCVPFAAAPFGLTMGLSLDSLFTKKASSRSTVRPKVTDSAFDVVDGLSPSSTSQHLSSSLESGLEAISSINAKWDANYPTAGFRSCQATSSDEITDSSIKVHFATGTKLKTVHIVGTEDRAGTWHHCVIDRERFQRRILDLEKIVSPVLEASHRAKVLEQNQLLQDRALLNRT